MTRIAFAMLAVTTDRMPCAVAIVSMPSFSASRPMAAFARSWRTAMRPPSRCVGLSVWSTTLASVTVGSSLPLP